MRLPATPPLRSEADAPSARFASVLGALRILKERNFLVFFICSILICIPLAFYYQHANQFLVEIGVQNATFKQSLGQVSEVVLMLLVPFFLSRFGIKTTLLIGMCAWTIRYALFAFGNSGNASAMILLGIALHGVCYDFFFVSGQIYTDSKAGPSGRSSAQGLVAFATYGVGMLVGFWVAGLITDLHAMSGNAHDWHSIWLYPAFFAAVVAVLFAAAFKNERVIFEGRK
jgi:nucleoside transporter